MNRRNLAVWALLTMGACVNPEAGEARESDSTFLESGTVDFGNGPVEVVYEVGEDGIAVLDGDVELGPVEAVRRGEYKTERVTTSEGPVAAAAVRPTRAWPGGRIPYKISSNYGPGSEMYTRIIGAINHWNQNTLIKLVPSVTPGEYHVRFSWHGSRCSSAVGKRTSGAYQPIHLKESCSLRTIIHEIGHAAGFHHEQARSDRDLHVTIEPDHIVAGKEHNFQTYDEKYAGQTGRGVDFGTYDYASIMHYGSRDFAKAPFFPPTILKDGCDAKALFIPPHCFIHKTSVLSDGDKLAANFLVQGASPDYVRLENQGSGLCLMPTGASRDSGASITTGTCSGLGSRGWDLLPLVGRDSSVVINQRNGLCMHHEGTGDRLVQRPCTGEASQRFEAIPSSGYIPLRKEGTDRCVHQVAGNSRAFLSVRCNNTSSRRWRAVAQ